MKPQNHEETIMRAYIWHLHTNGEPIKEAEQIAKKNINLFKRAEGDEIRAAEGHKNPVPIYTIAKYVTGKYLTSLNDFIKEAESKKTLHDLDRWWKQHQSRVRLNLSEHDFNEFAIKIMTSLRSKFEGEEDAVGVITTEDEQVQTSDCTDLVVRIDPKGLAVSDNFPQYAEIWRKEMRKADFIPQAEGDLKDIRDNEKKCREVEKAIDGVIDELSTHLEEVGKTDPKIKEYTDRLVDSRKKLRALKEETVAHRKKISNAPKRYMDDQKKKVVGEHIARVKDAANKLFVGAIAKGRDDADVKGRLIAAYKGKRTVDTVKAAIEEEAGRIIDEMNDRAALCRSNLEKIEASGRPALFQDQETLMIWESERLEQEIKLRIQKDDLLKAKIQRNPEKLSEWKDIVGAIDNIPHLDNWYLKHWDEVKESLPHEKDREELLQYCGERKQKLKAEYAKSVNNPPPPESPQQEHESASPHVAYGPAAGRYAEPAPPATDQQEEEEEEEEEGPEEFNLQFEFKLLCTKQQVKEFADDVYALIGNNPMLQGKITLRKV